jgi:hypothetical protein
MLGSKFLSRSHGRQTDRQIYSIQLRIQQLFILCGALICSSNVHPCSKALNKASVDVGRINDSVLPNLRRTATAQFRINEFREGTEPLTILTEAKARRIMSKTLTHGDRSTKLGGSSPLTMKPATRLHKQAAVLTSVSLLTLHCSIRSTKWQLSKTDFGFSRRRVKIWLSWVVAPCRLVEVYRWDIFVLIMEAASTLETSVPTYQITQRNDPEHSRLHLHQVPRSTMNGALSPLPHTPSWPGSKAQVRI